MRNFKKILALVLALTMVVGLMGVSVFAAEGAESYTLTINNTVNGHKYTAYQIFVGTKADTTSNAYTVMDPAGLEGETPTLKFDATETYFKKVGEDYVVDTTVTAENFATKVNAGLYLRTGNVSLGDMAWGADITDEGKKALYNEYGVAYTFTEDGTTKTDYNKNILALVEAIANNTPKSGTSTDNSESDAAVRFASVFYEIDNDTTGGTGNTNKKVNAAYLNTNPASSQIKDGNNGSITFDGLASGYYLIDDTYPLEEGSDKENGVDYSISRIMVQIVGNTTINNKADKPTLDKDIVEGETGSEVEVDTSNGSIGDEVKYKLDSVVPNMDGYESYLFEITDTMTKGLTFNDNVAIKIGDDTLNRVYKGSDGFFYPTEEKATSGNEADRVTSGFTVNYTTDASTKVTTVKIYIVNFIQYQAKAGNAIAVTYSATINQDALDTSAATNAGQENKAKLTFSNKPNESGKGTNGEPEETNPKGETPDSKVTTYTHGIEIFKVDANDSSKKLQDAAFTIEGDAQNVVIANNEMYVLLTSDEVAANDAAAAADKFDIYYMLKDGTYTKTEAGSVVDGKTVSADDYVSTTEKYKKITVVDKTQNTSTSYKTTAKTNESGYIEFRGLGEGVYTITETKAPSGYNILTAPIYVAIKFTVDDTDPTKGTFATYRYVKDATSAPTMPATFTKDEGAETYNSGAWELLGQTEEVKIESDIVIENNNGTELPSTGGIGTTIFYIVGGLLAVGAGVVLVSKKRMGKVDD